ncbi:MAG TPA: 4Fe-4S binding protein [Anaerolineae bacterium]|nr:4Fe-4S binding protein [Anaerolineae bacterium]
MKAYGRTPLNLHQTRIPRGQVYLIPERCKGCKLCIQFCPQQVLQESETANGKGYHYPEVTPGKEESCVHCEFCAMVCPEFAIYTLEVAQ